ncbi:MAG: hypothetical protein LIO62_06105 [Clostridiales bacterium]|nr:hypothetical protein [Clostridiales bacterium]
MNKNLGGDPNELLSRAIIVQAAKDYRHALGILQKNPSSRSALYSKREIETFFRSNWYQTLTEVDGEFLITKLQEEFK